MTATSMSSSIIVSLLLAAVFTVTAQPMSLSAVNQSALLFCYADTPPHASIRCIHSQQEAAPDFFEQVTPDPPWTPRIRPLLLVYPRPLHFTHTSGTNMTLPVNALVSTTYSDDNGKAANDVWATAAVGEAWYLIAGCTFNGSCAYGRFANSSFLPMFMPASIYNKTSGHIWSIGGSLSQKSDLTSDIWTSTNMIEWSQLNTTEHIFRGRNAAAATGMDYNGIFYVIAGLEGSASLYPDTSSFVNDVWSSSDALTWSKQATPPFYRRAWAQLVVVRSAVLATDILTLYGGRNENQAEFAEIWVSSDSAATWRCLSQVPPMYAKTGGWMDVTASNTLVMVGGYRYTNIYFSDTWVSFDGGKVWKGVSWGIRAFPHTNSDDDLKVYFSGYALDAEQHVIITGGFTDYEGNDAFKSMWRSVISVNDTSALTRSLANSVFIPSAPGLQCWPLSPEYICPDVSGTTVKQSLPRYDTKQTLPHDRLITQPFTLPLPSNSSTQPRIVSMSGSGSMFCILRSDHSIVCADVLANNESSSSSLAAFCPWTLSTTYQCGIGRPSDDGRGWIGSAYGHNSAVSSSSSSAATGFSYVSVTAISASSVGLFLLTWPNHHPTYYGPSSLMWHYTIDANRTQYTDRFCISPSLNETSNDELRRKPLRRHIEVQSLLHQAMQSVCGDESKACGLTMAGVIICWHSIADDTAPITISPPSYMRFAQLACGFEADSAIMTYACAITASAGMMGRLLCWEVSGTVIELEYLPDLTYWMFHYFFASVDSVLRQQMMLEWSKDMSTSGKAACMAVVSYTMRRLMDRHDFEKRSEALIIHRLTSVLVVTAVSCSHGSTTCLLVTSDGAAENDHCLPSPAVSTYRVHHRFISLADITTVSYDRGISNSPLYQAVELHNTNYTTFVSARVSHALTGRSSHYFSFDQTQSTSATTAWTSALVGGQLFRQQFDIIGSDVLCGLLLDPTRMEYDGVIQCNKPLSARFDLMMNTPMRQITIPLRSAAEAVTSSSTAGTFCAQRVNDSQWQCAASIHTLPAEMKAVNMSRMIPLTNGPVVNFTLMTMHAPWTAIGGFDKMWTYSRPLTFTHTNGTTLVLSANAILNAPLAHDAKYNYNNDIWASEDKGRTSVTK